MKKIAFIIIIVLFTAVHADNASSAEPDKISIHGFISQGYLKSDKNNFMAETEDGTFQFNEAGINFSADLSEKLHLGIQFFTYDIGDIGNNDIAIDWAFADYRWHDWLGFRAGKIKNPAGFYNETRDVDMLRTNILMPQTIYSDSHRDNVIALQGVGIYGNILPDFMGTISYQLQYGTMDIDAESGSSKTAEAAGPFDVTYFDVDYVYVASLRWDTFIKGLQVGGSLSKAKMDIGLKAIDPLISLFPAMTMEIEDFSVETLSVEYTWDNLILSSEYALISIENREMNNSVITLPETEIDSEGYYVSVSYRFTGWLELGAYYSEYYPDKDDKDGEYAVPDHSAWSKDFALSVRFDINKHWTFKLEGHSIDGTGMLFSSDNPDGTDKSWFLFAAKTTFHF
ncbi:MAG: porin [Desulfobacterales bacterium]|nr:porin [Desulfobacterales bacterium]